MSARSGWNTALLLGTRKLSPSSGLQLKVPLTIRENEEGPLSPILSALLV